MARLFRRADGGATALILVVVAVLFIGWLVNVNQRECRTNRDCGSESYCGSDYACHQYPNIQKTVIEYNFFWPSVIIGIAIIAAALIFRWNNLTRQHGNGHAQAGNGQSNGNAEPEEVEDISEPYYKTGSNNIKTP